MSPCSHWD